MAQNLYDGGAGTVALDTRLPGDYERAQATPEAFGGGIAHGMQELGQGAVKASQFYGQVAADDATNQLFDRWNKRMYGDPSRQVLQPDGTMGQDTGYMGLKGRAALDARPGLENDMEADIAEIRKNLSSPDQQLAFDRDSRRYRQALQQHAGQHAEGQFSIWGNEVNKAAGQTALTSISNTAYDDASFQHGMADLIHARVKDEQLKGGGQELETLAVQSGTQEAWKQRLETISVHDPAKAAQMADEHQKELGYLYEPLANQFRSRATQAIGIGAANDAVTRARTGAIQPPPPGSAGAALAAPDQPTLRNDRKRFALELQQKPWLFGKITNIVHGENNDPAANLAVIESAMNRASVNHTSLEQEFRRHQTENGYYAGWNPGAASNPAAAAMVQRNVARALNGSNVSNYATDNASGDFGRNRIASGMFNHTGTLNGEIFSYPGRNDARGFAAYPEWRQRMGGGEPSSVPMAYGQPVSQSSQAFLGTSMARANITSPQAAGTANPSLPQVDEAPPIPPAPPQPPQAPQASQQPATPEQIKAAAYQAIHDNPDLSQEAKEHAYREINQQITEQQVMEQANEKAKHEANEKAANGYVTRILNGNSAGIIQQIANDPALKWETKEHLVEAVKRHSGNDVEEAKLAYGPGFWSAYKAVTAAPGDPTRVADPTQLLRRAGPGGDLTLAGVQKLSQTMQQNQKSVNDQAVNTAKVGLLNYAKGKMSFDQEMMFPGVPPLKDPKGVAVFEGQFIPKFEAAYDQWTKDGKDPWQFLTQKNVDGMVEGMRPKAQMAMDRIAASGEAAPPDLNAKLPPAPQGVNPEAWTKVIGVPPPMENGKPFPYSAWGHAVSMLLADPSEANIQRFNESKFGKSGIDGKRILGEFSGKTVSNPFAQQAQPAAAQADAGHAGTYAEQHPEMKAKAAQVDHILKWLIGRGGTPGIDIHSKPLTKEDFDRAKTEHLWGEKGVKLDWSDIEKLANALPIISTP